MRRMMSEKKGGSYQFKDFLVSAPRRQGKTELIFARTKVGLVLTGERMIYSSVTISSAQLLFNKLADWVNNDDQLKSLATIYRGKGSESISIPGGGSIRFIARNNNASRGDGCDLIIFDEAQALTDDDFAAMDPLMADSPNPQAIFFGTPAVEKQIATSKFASLRKQVLANDDKFAYLAEWSADPSADFSAPETWAQANPAYNIRNVTEENLQRAYLRNSRQKFAIERLGVWGDVMHQTLVDQALWDALATTDPTPDPVVLAVDVSPDSGGDQTASVSLVGVRSDGLPQVEVVKNARGSQWVQPFVRDFCKKYKCPVVIDVGGYAAADIAPLKAAGVQVLETSTQHVKQASQNFLNTIQLGSLKHYDQVVLNTAVMGASKRRIGEGFGFSPASDAVDITPLVSASLAVFGVSLLEVKKINTPDKRQKISTGYHSLSRLRNRRY